MHPVPVNAVATRQYGDAAARAKLAPRHHAASADRPLVHEAERITQEGVADK